VDAFLTPPRFEPQAQTPARDVFLRPGRARIVYELFSSTLERRDGEAICLNSTTARPEYRTVPASIGRQLSAAWFFAAGGGLYVDLGRRLSEALRRSSAYEGKPAAWTALMRAVDPEALAAAGYRPCPTRHQPESCYCPPAAAAP
jgi:hypothetical protein